jgi:hypothetical protein
LVAAPSESLNVVIFVLEALDPFANEIFPLPRLHEFEPAYRIYGKPPLNGVVRRILDGSRDEYGLRRTRTRRL